MLRKDNGNYNVKDYKQDNGNYNGNDHEKTTGTTMTKAIKRQWKLQRNRL